MGRALIRPVSALKKASVMIQLSIAEEPRQHSKSARGERLVDEGLLAIQCCLDRRAAWQRVFTGRSVDDFGIQLTDRAQPGDGTPIPCVQRLPKDVLSARRIVPNIKPVGRCMYLSPSLLGR